MVLEAASNVTPSFVGAQPTAVLLWPFLWWAALGSQEWCRGRIGTQSFPQATTLTCIVVMEAPLVLWASCRGGSGWDEERLEARRSVQAALWTP